MAIVLYAIQIGKELQKRFPALGNDYATYTRRELVNRYTVMTTWNISQQVAETAVYYALHGYDGCFACITHDSYPGLLSEEQLDIIATKRHKQAGEKSGNAAVARGDGLHALSRKARKAAIRKSHQVRGHVVYSNAELLFILNQSSNPTLWRKQGDRLLLRAAAIAKQVNERFHKNQRIRNYLSISGLLARLEHHKKTVSRTITKKVKKVFELRDSLKATLQVA